MRKRDQIGRHTRWIVGGVGGRGGIPEVVVGIQGSPTADQELHHVDFPLDTCVGARACAHVYVCVCVCAFLCVCVRARVFVCACMRVCVRLGQQLSRIDPPAFPPTTMPKP